MRMKAIVRLGACGVLLAVLGVCVVGFIATFEPLPVLQQWTWRTAYGLVAVACIAGMIRPLRCQCRRMKSTARARFSPKYQVS
jgi:hypothetical protein